MKRNDTNMGAMHGVWGESVAVEYLRRGGYEIIERNTRPVVRDERLEIDIVAWDRAKDAMVFVEVKQHADMSPYARRLRSIDRRKKRNLLRACASWLMRNRWHGNYRFDVIEVWGGATDGQPPEIDHVENVPLFGPNWRFW